MYQVEKGHIRASRETVVVTRQGRRVCSASVGFVQWMHDVVPKSQLRPEQLAMVNWYSKQAVLDPTDALGHGGACAFSEQAVDRPPALH